MKLQAIYKADNHAGSQRQRQRQIAAGIFYFAGGKGHIVPGIGGKQRSDLGDRQDGQRADQHSRTAHSHLTACCVPARRCARNCPESWPPAPAHCARRTAPAATRPKQCGNFGKGKNILDQRAGLHAEDVHHREQQPPPGCATRFCVFSPVFHIAQDHRAQGMNAAELSRSAQSSWRKKSKERKCRETCRTPRPQRRWFRSG